VKTLFGPRARQFRFNALTDLRTFPRNLEPDFTHYLCEQRKEMEIYERSRQRNHSHNGPPHQIHTYADLRQQIHDDLRLQHPEWIQPNGESPSVILTKRAS
jgi:hypothetical protein